MEPPNLFDQISAVGADAIRAALESTAGYAPDTYAEESCHTLLCMAVERLYDVAILTEGLRAHVANVGDPTSWLLQEGVRDLRDACGDVVQLLMRALDAHARDAGYAPDVCRRSAVRIAAIALRGDVGTSQRPDASDATRAAVVSTAAALRDCRLNPIAVPGHLASAIGCASALFMLASALLDRSDVP